MHAVDFLQSPDRHASVPVVVLYGAERQLVQESLHSVIALALGGGEDDDLSVTSVVGNGADFRQVRDELFTVSMFATKRVVVVEDADEFVSTYRSELEAYVDRPSQNALLVLECKTWRSNTRLARTLADVGLVLECTELTAGRLVKWLVERMQTRHGKQLSRDAAGLLVELVGNCLSLLDQELSKLAAYAGMEPSVGAEDVRKLVGGWKAETTWTMTNAIRDGELGLALKCLDQLLASGEAPQKIMGGITFVFRKLARATEHSRQGVTLNVALKENGVFPRDVDASARYLRRIGRQHAERMTGRLVKADVDLKGGSRLSERMLLELLLLDLAGGSSHTPQSSAGR